MKKWRHLFNQMDKQDHKVILDKLIDQVGSQPKRNRISRLLLLMIIHMRIILALIKCILAWPTLDRLSLIYLAMIITNWRIFTQHNHPSGLAVWILLGGSFAIAVSIESIIQFVMLILKLAASRDGDNRTV